MAKTYLMPGEAQTEEQKQEMRKHLAEKEVQQKERMEQQVAADKTKIKVTLEQLLETRIEPAEDRVVVWPDPVESVTAGGILKPQEAIDKERPMFGTVVAVGPGKLIQENLTNYLLLQLLQYGSNISKDTLDKVVGEVGQASEIPLKPGDRILYGRFAGTQSQDPDTKTDLLIMRPHDIFGKIRP